MRAAYITELGSADEIRVGELPRPTPGPTDVLVRVEALAVNPVDTFVRSGAYRTPTPFPFVVGRDVVGSVVSAGPGAVGFAPEQRVWSNSLGHGGRQGPFAEYAVVPADRLYHLPDGVDPVAAVSVLHPVATAELALFHHGRLQFGETVYVGGAAGNVGTALVQLAVQGGAHVIASAGAEDLARVRSLGAATVVDYRDPSLPSRLRDAAPGGVDIACDTSGRMEMTTAVDLLALRGRLVLLAGARFSTPLPVRALYTRDASVLGFAISNAAVGELAAAADRINQRLLAGDLHPRVAAVLPLEQTARAHRWVTGEGSDPPLRGRLVVRP